MSDEELINRIRQGDEAAAEELIGRCYPSVFRYCRVRCEDRETAEDLTQETFLRFFKYLSSYRAGGNLRAYLFSIARRLCSDQRRTPRASPLENEGQVADPRDGLRRLEDQSQIRGLLQALPPGQREAVILRFGERLTYRDIARATGCNTRAAQGRVRCALKKMRKELDHE